MASHGFVHYDIIDQTYLCYLLPRTGNLLLTRLEKSNSDFTPIFGLVSSIPAKDAIALNVILIFFIDFYTMPLFVVNISCRNCE